MAARHALFGVTPVVFTVLTALACIRGHVFAFDFHYAYWTAAHRVLAGASPYVNPQAEAARSNMAFIYPPAAAIFLAPFALLPRAVGDGLFTTLVIAATLGALRLLDVRDWRLYGLVLIWPPVVTGWQNANVTLLLVLGAAGVWRWRDRAPVAGILTALLISLKPLVWPLALWLLATRRYAAMAYAVVTGIAVNVAAFATLGQAELSRYLRLLSAVTRAEERGGYSVVTLALHLGSSQALGYALGLVLAAVAGTAAIVAARRGEDMRAMLLCIATTLLATPILWVQYLALLLVPLALARPRLSVVWLLPMMTLVAPEAPPHMYVRVLVPVVGAGVVGLLLLNRSPVRALAQAPSGWPQRVAVERDS